MVPRGARYLNIDIPNRTNPALARSHSAECPEGCPDLPLDLVDMDDLVAIATRAEALSDRVAALREIMLTLADAGELDWPTLQARARDTLRLTVPTEPEVGIIAAWGCPHCGRIDAPQPCLGICVRRPGLVADAVEYREFSRQADQLTAEEGPLMAVARLIAWVRPHPGPDAQTVESLRRRDRALSDL
jgi:hypothetical protein